MIDVGDLVCTVKGASYEGEVRTVFKTRKGKDRAVVEAVEEKFDETLHVYPLEQLLVLIPKAKR